MAPDPAALGGSGRGGTESLTPYENLILCFTGSMSSKMNILAELRAARRKAGLQQGALAERAGVSRMTVQRIEAQTIDPRLSTLLVMARALGLDLMLVPAALRPALEDFVRAGGRLVGQEPGIGAPPSIVDTLARAPREPTGGDE